MGKVVIIGGGIIGLFTAYYLSEEGFQVTILDKGDLRDNCSLGNAGMIVPSHLVPLASPGIIGKGLKWMLSSTSPFYIHPKLDRRLLQWCLLFYKAANQKHVDYSMPYLRNLSLLSKNLYLELARQHPATDLGLKQNGLVMLYKTKEVAQEEIAFAHLARQYGLATEVLSKKEVQALEPHCELNVLGGVLFPEDAHLDPGQLVSFLIRHLENKGVKMLRQAQVLDFAFAGKAVEKVITDKGEEAADYVVVCAGSWSGQVARKLKISLPMQGGKGYSFLVENKPAIQQLAILVEGRVAVTPYERQIRFGGTMEITNTNQVNMNRVQGIHDTIGKYYAGFTTPLPDKKQVWSGLRPCSPDGLPYIGFTQQWNNVLFGTGHSMMGISLAPATGKILAEQIKTGRSAMAVDAFAPDRYN
jgi:D-amino-acid dehydrogenase